MTLLEEFDARVAERNKWQQEHNKRIQQIEPVCTRILEFITEQRRLGAQIWAIHLHPDDGRVLEENGRVPDRIWGYPLFITPRVPVGEVAAYYLY